MPEVRRIVFQEKFLSAKPPQLSMLLEPGQGATIKSLLQEASLSVSAYEMRMCHEVWPESLPTHTRSIKPLGVGIDQAGRRGNSPWRKHSHDGFWARCCWPKSVWPDITSNTQNLEAHSSKWEREFFFIVCPNHHCLLWHWEGKEDTRMDTLVKQNKRNAPYLHEEVLLWWCYYRERLEPDSIPAGG